MDNSLEYLLSNLLTEDLINYIESNPEKMGELILLAKSNRPPDSSRAAWLLSKVAGNNQSEIKEYIPQILDILPTVKDGQKRDLINTLTLVSLDEDEEGLLFERCIDIWSNLNQIPSVRFCAFKFILQTCKKYPELGVELDLLSEDYYLESLSAGIRRIVYKRIVEFRNQNKKKT